MLSVLQDLQGGAEMLIPSSQTAEANPRHFFTSRQKQNLEAKDPLILEGKAQQCLSKAPTAPREMQALTEGRASP